VEPTHALLVQKIKEHYMMKPLDVIAENTVGFFINK
jgi:hypothetical protein